MNKTKILVAMSGGVDSSVTAALLKKAGYDVTGVFMINWQDQRGGPGAPAPGGRCSWEQDQTDARKVAHKLGIKLYTWNFVEEYKKYVFDYFIEAIKDGLTPNPDTICNKYIKFGSFLDRARELGFEMVATGHYARVIKTQKNPEGDIDKCRSTTYELFAGRDKTKDQSYFLYELNQEQLSRVMFPIGKYKKKKIRALAKKFDLPVWNKKDSYGICYIGERNMPQFLGQFIDPNPGDIIDGDGKVLGQHQGLHNYTLGQRQGIKIGGTGPYYVVKKDYENNNLVATNNAEDPGLFSQDISVGQMNWIANQRFNKSIKQPIKKFNCLVRTRHLKSLERCEVQILNDNSVKVVLGKPQKAVTPGQAAVFYQAQGLFKKEYKVLGGGIILEAH